MENFSSIVKVELHTTDYLHGTKTVVTAQAFEPEEIDKPWAQDLGGEIGPIIIAGILTAFAWSVIKRFQ